MTDRTRSRRGDGTVHQRADIDTNTEGGSVTLTEFLLARIAEDEELARAADGTRWFHADKVVSFEAFGPDSDWVDASSPISVDTRANGWHITNWAPQRVLAECEAKRRLIERIGNPDWAGFRYLALPYADHPDYDEAWRV